MEYYLIILLAGLAGSMHCVGMCGGFACILGRDGRGRLATLARHLVYNLGRVTSYCFMGVCVGYLGFLLVGHGGDHTWGSLAQRTLALLSGLLMLYIGLQFLGLLPRSAGPLLGVDWLASGLRQLTRSTRPGAPLALGVLNGFLPCPLVYAFLAQAAGSGGPLSGLLIMATFGLGTFPAMLAMGGIGWWAGARRAQQVAVPVPTLSMGPGSLLSGADWRQRSVQIAGGFIVLLGVVTVARGLLPLGAHLH
jgi:uncharacterized protein